MYRLVNRYESRAWFVEETETAIRDRYVVGTVSDGTTGGRLIGATVTIQGTKLATITDFDGEYRLQVPAGTHTIDYGYVGYRVGSSEVTITKNKRLDVSMYKNQAAEVRTGQTPVIVDRAATTTAGDQPHEQILVLLDGKKIDRDSVDRIDPQTIEAINVLKDVEKIRALGHGAGYTGAVLIKSYK